MNKPEGFDDLVRRKLEERAFSFDEAHWLEAQRAILAAQRRKRPSGWWLAAPAALLIGLGGWWAMDSTETTVAIVQETPSPVVRSVDEPKVQEHAQEAIPASAPALKGNAASDQVTTSPSSVTADRSSAEAAVADKPEAERTAGPSSHPRENQPALPNGGSAPMVPQDKVRTGVKTEATIATIDVATKNEEPDPFLASDERLSTSTKSDTDAAAKSLVAGSALVADPDAGGSGVPSEPTTTATEEPAVQVAQEPVVQGNSADSLVAATRTVVDSTAATVDSASAGTVPPAPPLVDAASPWEISAMAGIMATSSHYKGAGSDAWSDGISSEPTPTYGAEFMHMGRNFGIGSGLHYSTYAERIHTEERTNTLIDIENYWYLQPVQLDVLVVTDIFDSLGVTYYVGETQNTVVNVLTPGADTTVTTTVLRSGRDQVNRTSYLEVPLLLDAHLTQGRWMFGLRGGPMLGVLTGRQGAVPNATDDGYDEFTDQSFSSLIVGYTARAYIRYRFNSAWSIGVEPTIKGHLMDTYSSGDLSRRSTGYGGVLSLTYRLR